MFFVTACDHRPLHAMLGSIILKPNLLTSDQWPFWWINTQKIQPHNFQSARPVHVVSILQIVFGALQILNLVDQHPITYSWPMSSWLGRPWPIVCKRRGDAVKEQGRFPAHFSIRAASKSPSLHSLQANHIVAGVTMCTAGTISFILLCTIWCYCSLFSHLGRVLR